MTEELNLNEESDVREGGKEFQEDPQTKAAREQKEKDPDTLANPTELAGGGNSTGPGTHSGGPSST